MEGIACRINFAMQSVCDVRFYLNVVASRRMIDDLPLGTQERVEKLFDGPRAFDETSSCPFATNGTSASSTDRFGPLASPASNHGSAEEDDDLDDGDLGESGDLEQDDLSSPAIDEEFDKTVDYGADADISDYPEQQEDDASSPTSDQAAAQGDDEEIEWTPEMVQAIREKTYITFEGEDETNYTRGPARMIDAADGVVTCTALLLTVDLSQAVQASIKAQRDFGKAQAAAEERLDDISSLQSDLRKQIGRTEIRLDSLSEQSEEDEPKRQALAEELSILNMMVEEYKLERSSIYNSMEFQGAKLRDIQAEVNALLEDAWIHAKLLEPESDQAQDTESVSPPDLQTEYLAFREKLKQSGDMDMLETADAQLDTSNDHLNIPTNPAASAQEQELQRLHKAVWAAWPRFEAAQTNFDRRDWDRDDAVREREALTQRGEWPEDATSEAFDVRWHLYERGLTRELLDAEAAYEKANAEAMAAGAIGDFDKGTDEGDSDNELDDGYRVSFEREMSAFAPRGRIERWMGGIPDYVEQMCIPDASAVSALGDAEEWEAEALEVGDSMSEILWNESEARHNRLRKKTDEWQEVQRQLAAGFAWMKS